MNNDHFPTRKPNRLNSFDYSCPGAYFLTLCTNSRANYFWGTTEISEHSPIALSDCGKIAVEAIANIPKIYPSVTVDHYVIMPNHIHLLLQLHPVPDPAASDVPSINRIIQQMKGYIFRQIGFSVWQKLYYDHVVRNKKDYDQIVRYIHENPYRWQFDCLYSP